MPVTNYNRTITQVAVAQGGAGTTDVVAAPGVGLRLYVVAIVLSATGAGAGSIKFTEGTGPTDLTGAMPVAVSGGFVIIGDGFDPILHTNTANSKLSIVTATVAASGYIRYFVEQ